MLHYLTEIGYGSTTYVFQTQKKRVASDQGCQPSNDEIIQVLECIDLGHLMNSCDGLDALTEQSSVLSLGEL